MGKPLVNPSLEAAASNGDLRIVKVLLAHRADPALKDDKGRTARDYALEAMHPEVAALFKP